MRESSVERSAGDLVRVRPLQFSGPVSVTALRRGAVWLAIGLLLGCKKGGEEPPRPHGPAFERGDRVVAELVGGEFFEGRVLAVTGERLRIERLRTREVLMAAPGDLYRLPARLAPKEPGRLAICGTASEEWIGCRIAGVSDGELEVTTLDDRKLSLPRSSVLATSQVTELNLKQRFERRAARARFLEEAMAAGEPTPPSGYRPQLHARVVAPRQGQWWSAVVEGLDDEDEEVTIRFIGDGLEQTLARAAVVPESVANAAPVRGAFVLVRPGSPADAWWRARVVATLESDARIVDGDGVERSVGFRDLLPLGAR